MIVPGTESSRLFVLGLTLLAAVSCGGDSTQPQELPKIPISTASIEARQAYLEGRELFENVRLTEANQRFRAAVEADPSFATGWLMVANTSATAPDFFAALRSALAEIDGASDGERLRIEAFQANVNGETDVERASLEALVAAYPGDERAHSEFGIFLAAQQEYQAAIESYEMAIAINPGFPQPYNQLGYALRTVGDFEGAEKAFLRYAELVPDQPNPYDSYGELLMKIGRFEDSIAAYEKALAIDPEFVASYIGIGNSLIFMGRHDEARSSFARLEVVARSPGERRQGCTWAAASYLHEDNFDSALQSIQRRFEIAAESNDFFAMAGDLNMMGDILLAAGRAEEAVGKYRESIELAQESDAPDDLKQAVVRNTTFDIARAALSKAKLKRATELAASYREAVAELEIRGEVQQVHELTGMLAIASGDFETALWELAHANQENPRVMLLTGRAFQLAGDAEAARQACAQVVDFNEINLNLAYVRNAAIEFIENL
jgi:tetratricopeptide (TPR) repeat protein